MEKQEENFEQRMNRLNAKAQIDHNKERDKAEEREAAERKKNDDFFMVFKKNGSPLLRDLITVSPIGARLFMLLAEQADRTNAIVASGKALAAALQVSEASISRAIKTLIEKKLIDKLNTGGSNVFILNPDVVWSAWKTGKDFCMFGNAKVLISKSEQDTHTKKRLNVLFEKQQQLDLEQRGEQVEEMEISRAGATRQGD